MPSKAFLPPPTLERLARIYVILGKLSLKGLEVVSSKELSVLLGVPDHTIRKDISLLKGEGIKEQTLEQEIGGKGKGYPIIGLRSLIGHCLGFSQPRSACIVGLGNLGKAMLHRKIWQEGVYRLAAAFDSSENQLELLKTTVPLYHVRELERVVKQERIEIGIITVPAEAAQNIADRLVQGGIRGIINFAPTVLTVPSPHVIVRNLSLAGELHVLSAYLHQEEENNG
ncbi:MAG: redox-sensing transcriptional repressor Rex [Spirochaetales bacterium]